MIPVSISRRKLVFLTAVAPLAAAFTLPKLKILVAGGHPGDPECGCAGTIARYAALGHEVILLYLNRGEGYCQAADLSQCASIRTAEAFQACKILKASAAFAEQLDSHSIVDNSHYEAFRRLLDSQQPDIVFSQWPIDQHRDHRAISMLVLDAWLQGGRKFALYYYEVSGDTMMFNPSEYVDISDPGIQAIRRAACYAHASQLPDKWYPAQVELTRFRGSESGHAQAEAFLRHWQSKSAFLP